MRCALCTGHHHAQSCPEVTGIRQEDWNALGGDFRQAQGDLHRAAEASGVKLPDLAPGIGVAQRKLEREADEAAQADTLDEPSDGAWLALGLVLLALGGFVTIVVAVVRLLRSCFVLPLLLLLILAVSSAIGCARLQPAPAPAAPITIPAAPRSPEILVLSERVGGTVAELIEAVTGQHPFAATIPGLPIIVFSPKDSTDPGLIAHELVHVRQQADMGPLRWSAVYARDLLACEASGVSRAVCLKTIPLEAEAYWVQRGISTGGGL